jgi:hypothetical protein
MWLSMRRHAVLVAGRGCPPRSGSGFTPARCSISLVRLAMSQQARTARIHQPGIVRNEAAQVPARRQCTSLSCNPVHAAHFFLPPL